MSEKCDPEVFKHGDSLGMFDMTKEKADEFCSLQTQVTGRKHDWHYAMGRVHIKALPDTVMVKMPKELTAENGAKGLLSGEFFEVVELECTACDQNNDDCEVCSGNGSYIYRVPVSWATIKEIYAKAVEHFGG